MAGEERGGDTSRTTSFRENAQDGMAAILAQKKQLYPLAGWELEQIAPVNL
jgi:hypothetical protein